MYCILIQMMFCLSKIGGKLVATVQDAGMCYGEKASEVGIIPQRKFLMSMSSSSLIKYF